MTQLSPQQLALAAERRVWSVILDTDEQVLGLPPTAVTECARRRLDYLDTQLVAVPVSVQDDALEHGASQVERDAAFDDAGRQMQAMLTLVAAAAGGRS